MDQVCCGRHSRHSLPYATVCVRGASREGGGNNILQLADKASLTRAFRLECYSPRVRPSLFARPQVCRRAGGASSPCWGTGPASDFRN